MKTLSQLSTAICLCLFAGIISAAPVKKDTLNNLLLLSGINSQMQELSGALQYTIKNASNVGTRHADKINKAIDIAIDPDAILEGMAQEIGNRLNETEAQELVTWYESNLGNRFARAEEHASSPEGIADMRANAAALMANQDKVAAARKLAQEAKLIEASVDSQKPLILAALVASTKARNPDAPVNLEMLNQMVSTQISSMRPMIEQSLLLSVVYVIQDFDVAEVDAYVQQLKTPAMIKFNEGGRLGGQAAVEKAINAYVAALGRR